MTLATAAGVAACSGPAKPSSDLAKDLDAASSASPLALAPTTGKRDVISAVERSPDARRAPAPAHAELVKYEPPLPPPPAPAPVAAAPAVITPATAVAAAPAAASPAPAPVPITQSRRPMQQQTQPGRYKTEAEVFRNAPFPIMP
jgi:hypothetical protein